MTDGPHRSPSGQLAAQGAPLSVLADLRKGLQRAAAETIRKRSDSEPDVLAGWIAQESSAPLTNALLEIWERGKERGGADAGAAIAQLSQHIGEAHVALSALLSTRPELLADLGPLARALRAAAAALPARTP